MTTHAFPFTRLSNADLLFVADEYGGPPIRVAILSHDLWKERFGGSPTMIGQRITLDGQPFVVVGIAEPCFTGPAAARLYLPQQRR